MGEIVVWIIPWETIDCVSTSARHVFGLHKFTRIMTSFRLCLYGEKLARGPGTPFPSANFTARLHGKKREPGYDELSLSTDWNISVRMLCVARLGPARRVDSLETVYTRKKNWLISQGHPVSPTEWPYPPGLSYSPSQVFSFSCKRSTMIYKQLYGKLGSPRLARWGGWGGSPDHLFSV